MATVLENLKLSYLDPRTLWRIARKLTRKLWVRVVAMGLLAFFALLLTQVLGGLVPDWLAGSLTDNATDTLLSIIANAMLAVTIFSITIMVSVYQASSSQWTPRIHRLIIEDKLTQNTIAVFIGAYVYALVAIVLRELGIYQKHSSFLLFVMTVLVLLLIVYYLIRWVLHLQSFGSLIDTTRQIETVAAREFAERLQNPCLGANAHSGAPPEGARVISADTSGHIQTIYPEELNSIGKHYGVEIYLTRNIGSFVFVNAPLAHVVVLEGDARQEAEKYPADDWQAVEDKIKASIVLGDLRTFSQDPRFALLSMGEIGTKALSPGINDAGTAIDVIGRLGRILSSYKDETKQDREELLDMIYVAPLDPRDLIEDSFGAISRDGVGTIEVQQRLQQVMNALRRHPDEGLSEAAREAAVIYLRRALRNCTFEPDAKRLLDSAPEDIRAEAEKHEKE